jgi:hypothetical protein
VNVYTCNNFKGHWPVGSAAVVVAEDSDQARMLLNTELKLRGLKQDVDKLKLVRLRTLTEKVRILCDGDY